MSAQNDDLLYYFLFQLMEQKMNKKKKPDPYNDRQDVNEEAINSRSFLETVQRVAEKNMRLLEKEQKEREENDEQED